MQTSPVEKDPDFDSFSDFFWLNHLNTPILERATELSTFSFSDNISVISLNPESSRFSPIKPQSFTSLLKSI